MSIVAKIFFLGLMIFSSSCKGTSKAPKDVIVDQVQEVDSLPDYNFPYVLEKEEQVVKLPIALQEISGITFSNDEKSFYAIEDENGVVYQVDVVTGKIIDKFSFRKQGDYEDVVLVKGAVYVLKSTGTIYKIINLGAEDQHFEKYNTILNKINDVEGLAYDAQGNSLLLACKGEPNIEGEERDYTTKAIYKFDLEKNELSPAPLFVISLDAVRSFVQTHRALNHWEKLEEYFGDENDQLKLSPSALAFHPISGNLYILSSKKRLLLVLDRAHHILHIEKLSKKNNIQPEGLAFSKNGDLYIANEGRHLKGTIYKYSYRH